MGHPEGLRAEQGTGSAAPGPHPGPGEVGVHLQVPRPGRCWPFPPGSDVLRLAPARRPSPLLSSVLGSWGPGPGLPVGQTGKVHGAPGHAGGGGVGRLGGGFGMGEWQQGDSLAGPAVAGEGAPLAVGVKATGLWVDFRAFSWAGSSSSRWWSSGFRCRVGRGSARLGPVQGTRAGDSWARPGRSREGASRPCPGSH